MQAVRDLAPIAALRQIHRRVDSNPNRQLNSVEALYRGVLKRGQLPRINAFVDVYNLVSLRTGASLGAHDLNTIATPVQLRRLAADTPFIPLGADSVQTARQGEFAYLDGEARLLCRLDVVQAEFSKVTERTTEAILIVEVTSGHEPSRVQQAFDDCVALIQQHCRGRVRAVVNPL